MLASVSNQLPALRDEILHQFSVQHRINYCGEFDNAAVQLQPYDLRLRIPAARVHLTLRVGAGVDSVVYKFKNKNLIYLLVH